MDSRRARWTIGIAVLTLAVALEPAWATDEPPGFAGAAFGTTYRVTLAAAVPGRALGECHREAERILRAIDQAASTWRDDSDAARFNRTPAGEWVEVADHLAAILLVARQVHAASAGAFDPTVAPLLPSGAAASARPPTAEAIAAARDCIGLDRIELQPAAAGKPARIRKTVPGVTIDLGGIGPGYAVDCIGAQLHALGSRGHLVALGGEVRAWGCRADGTAWRVALANGRLVTLATGEAIATATIRPGRSPVDPRTGRPVAGSGSWSVLADSCGQADAWAVAAAVLHLEAGPDGLVDRREEQSAEEKVLDETNEHAR